MLGHTSSTLTSGWTHRRSTKENHSRALSSSLTSLARNIELPSPHIHRIWNHACERTDGKRCGDCICRRKR